MISPISVAIIGLTLGASCSTAFANQKTTSSCSSAASASQTLSASTVLDQALAALGGRDAVSALKGVAFNA